MPEKTSLSKLLESLSVRNIIELEEIEAIHTWMNQEHSNRTPVFINLLYGAGAWIASLFFLFFLFQLDLFQFDEASIAYGIACFIVSALISHGLTGIFTGQLATALAITGNCLLLIWSVETNHRELSQVLVLTQATICILIYPLCKIAVYRFLSPVCLVALILFYMYEENCLYLIHALIISEALLFGFLLFKKRVSETLAPLFYVSSFTLPGTLILFHLLNMNILTRGMHEPMLISSISLSFSFIIMILIMAGGFKSLAKPWMILSISTTLLLGLFTTPGILIAVALMVSGYHYGYRTLMALSFIFMPCFLFIYYYSLNMDLAYKSLVLIASGLLLLGVRIILKRIRKHKVVS